MRSMKVVITGAAGLMGRHLAADLDTHGHGVVCIDREIKIPLPGRSIEADITDMARLEPAMRGADAVAHLARIPFPYTANGYNAATNTWHSADRAGDAEKFSLNVSMTYNVLAAAACAGVRKLVLGSSFAVYGLYYPSRPLMPAYLPIDEAHFRRPDDAYGLTKLVGEELADAFVSGGAMQIASLRFPGVSREDRQSLVKRRADPMVRGIGGLWTYVDARDAATACRLSLEADFDGHETFNICAPTTFMTTPTDELLQRYAPGVPCIGQARPGFWAAYSTAKAERMLGFRAQHLITL